MICGTSVAQKRGDGEVRRVLSTSDVLLCPGCFPAGAGGYWFAGAERPVSTGSQFAEAEHPVSTGSQLEKLSRASKKQNLQVFRAERG